MRAAIVVPTGAINPVTVGDQGGLCMLGQVGEFLCVANPTTFELEPVLADSWTANSDSSEWTFKLKSGVTFHDGSPLVADDVVYTMDLLSDSKGTSQALSVFRGVLDKGGTTAVDDSTVEFTLDAPNGNFPYLVSRTTTTPSSSRRAPTPSDFEKTFPGTGPFKLDKYTPKVGASFVRNDDYWGTKAKPDRIEFTFYDDEGPQILALQGKQVDVVSQISVSGGQAILNDPSYVHPQHPVDRAPPGAHAQRQGALHRQARPPGDRARRSTGPRIVSGLFQGKADIGNDSPFAPRLPVDRHDGAAAHAGHRAGQAAARRRRPRTAYGQADHGEGVLEIPDYASSSRSSAKAIGVNIDILVEADAYYGDACSAARTGWTRSWASPTTATAACPTCPVARR